MVNFKGFVLWACAQAPPLPGSRRGTVIQGSARAYLGGLLAHRQAPNR